MATAVPFKIKMNQNYLIVVIYKIIIIFGVGIKEGFKQQTYIDFSPHTLEYVVLNLIFSEHKMIIDAFFIQPPKTN